MPSSLAAVPAYFLVILGAYGHSQRLLMRSANPKAYDNSNPRATTNPAVFAKALGPRTFARWERAKAAHLNGLESLPLFAATILSLRSVGWDEGGMAGIAAVAWFNVALRFAYTVLFVNTETKKNSYWRSLCWIAATLVNLVMLFLAAGRA